MARRRQRQKRNGRRMKRSARRNTARSRQAAAPPRLSITASNTRTRLYYAVAVADAGVHTTTLSSEQLLSGTNAGYQTVFCEYKVHSVSVYYQANNAYSDSGSIALNVSDFEENPVVTLKTPFTEVCIMPGTMVRRVYQNMSSRWYPTEPEDRDFRSLDAKWNICNIMLRHSTDGSKFNGQLIVVAYVTFRGRKSAIKVSEAMQRCVLGTNLLERSSTNAMSPMLYDG